MSFDHLGLAPELLSAVRAQGYTIPTPVQDEAIPLVLAGRDVLAGAQTGTGKTAAFVLPILDRLQATPVSADRRRNRPPVRVLVLAPTRELALQVEESVRTYGAHTRIRSVAIYGGVGFEPQARALRAGPEIVVATPGRLLDHYRQRTIDLSAVEVLVLDEADRMLDMGFIRDIRAILAVLPARRQNLLFSATFSDEIRRLADGLLSDPATVQVTPRNAVTDLARQLVITVDRERKRALLTSLVRSGRIDQALVFTRTKHGASRLAEQLIRDGIAAAPIHGNRSQPQRVRALNDFKAGRVSILVATDIAARGIDIDALPHVINFELPMVAEDYVHRIGRTGRAGVDGDAISLVCVDELPLLRDIERLLRRPIEKEVVPGFEPDPSIRPEPIGRRVDRGRPVPLRGMPQRGVAQRGHVPARAVPQRSIGRRGPVRPGVNSQPGHLVQRAHVPPYGSGPQHGHGHATPRGTGYRPVGMPDRRPGGQPDRRPGGQPVALPGERLSGRVNRTPDRGH